MAGGRPKKQIDYDVVLKLASIMCTQEEIASFLGISVKTLQRDDEFSRIYKEGQGKGKISLRRSQFKIAERNASMAIWLGKQYLGQRDSFEYDSTETLAKVDKILESLSENDR